MIPILIFSGIAQTLPRLGLCGIHTGYNFACKKQNLLSQKFTFRDKSGWSAWNILIFRDFRFIFQHPFSQYESTKNVFFHLLNFRCVPLPQVGRVALLVRNTFWASLRPWNDANSVVPHFATWGQVESPGWPFDGTNIYSNGGGWIFSTNDCCCSLFF